MLQRGKKSAAALLVKDRVTVGEYLPAPKILSAEERKLWDVVVKARPPTYFRPDQATLLVTYVRGYCELEELQRAAKKVHKLEAPNAYYNLTRAEVSRTSALALLARALRISPEYMYRSSAPPTKTGAAAKDSGPVLDPGLDEETFPPRSRGRKRPSPTTTSGGSRPWEE